MSWESILGILGFVLSIVTFSLTRWEKRKTLVVTFQIDDHSRLRDELIEDCEDDLLIIRFVNTGTRSIVLQEDTLRIFGNGQGSKSRYYMDWFGIDKIPHPLNPGCSCEVGVFLDAFLGMIEVDSMSREPVDVSAEVRDIEGRRYRNKSKYELLPEVSDIRKKS